MLTTRRIYRNSHRKATTGRETMVNAHISPNSKPSSLLFHSSLSQTSRSGKHVDQVHLQELTASGATYTKRRHAYCHSYFSQAAASTCYCFRRLTAALGDGDDLDGYGPHSPGRAALAPYVALEGLQPERSKQCRCAPDPAQSHLIPACSSYLSHRPTGSCAMSRHMRIVPKNGTIYFKET